MSTANLNETIWTPGELAARLKIHKKTILRRFQDRAGVVRIVGPGGKNVTLRIPDSAVQAWLEETTRGWTLSTGRRGRQ